MCVTVHSGLCRLSHCPTVPLTVLEIPRTCFCLHSGSTYRLRCVYAACASWWQKITVHLWHLRSLAAAAAAVGFLLLVVSIYGKLLKLYGNLFACQGSLYVCVCESFILFRYAYFTVVIVFPLLAALALFH